MNEAEKFAKERELDFAGHLESYKATIQFGVQAVKSLLLVAGGAAAALLAFMGHLVTNDKVEYAKQLAMPLGAFFLASLFACAVFAFSYLTQYDATMDNGVEAEKWHRVSMAFTALAFLACFAGMAIAYKAFMGF